MKKLLLLSMVLLSALGVAGQELSAPEPVRVQSVYLAKDDGTGRAGDEATQFETTDIPIYCVVQLDSVKPATVRMNLVAVNVRGVRAETKVVTISYTTNGKQDRVNFTGKPDGIWTAGRYRIDVSVDGKIIEKREFDIVAPPARKR